MSCKFKNYLSGNVKTWGTISCGAPFLLPSPAFPEEVVNHLVVTSLNLCRCLCQRKAVSILVSHDWRNRKSHACKPKFNVKPLISVLVQRFTSSFKTTLQQASILRIHQDHTWFAAPWRRISSSRMALQQFKTYLLAANQTCLSRWCNECSVIVMMMFHTTPWPASKMSPKKYCGKSFQECVTGSHA